MTTVDPDYAAVADAVKRQQRPLALTLAAKAVNRGSRHPLILVLAAEALEENGQADKAIDLLRDATHAAPTNRVAWMRLASLLAKKSLYAEGAEAFEAALKVDPRAFPALMGAGEMRLMLNDMPASQRHYELAAEVEPRAAAPLAVLAVMAAQRRDSKAARALAMRASALQPGIIGAELALARADLLDGAPEATEDRLSRLLARTDLTEDHRIGAHDIRAEARDAMGRSGDAFIDYQTRNGIQKRMHAARFEGSAAEHPPSLARGLTALLEATTAEDWRAPPIVGDPAGGGTREHVFLVGFPRSGTTLLEKALAGQPDIVTLEEINHLAAAGRGYREDEAAWRRLMAITPEEAAAARAIYWNGVRGSLGDVTGKILVDKLPLHTQALPLIAKLFPDAKILFAVRDPRDVVLSCFRRRFEVNLAMYEFLTIEGAANYYDAVMNLAVTARRMLPLELQQVRHEAIIEDFDAEVGQVLAFIGAEWNDGVRNFADRVGGKVRTPSYSQLARGLNAEGVGQWRRYERHLAPVLPTLDSWARHYNY